MPSKSKDSGFIDLGKTYDGPSPCCQPESPAAPKKPSYPCLYICTDKKLDIGEMGECAIKYARKQVGERTKDDGSVEYTYELDVQGLKPLSSADIEEEEGEDMSSEPKSIKGFRGAMMSGMSDKGAKY